ncbi:hypothetical protein PLANPX_5844 [Lacipirellula parvula]|uniref:Uncharacterized protein n=1 Tax=Lacipirellula parvula TaxID=2650471 RepID=A0A5K7XJF9_9BACT|nr:hypothetical protein PLANPX_5844 [Lacipirellula parvula]
MPLWFNSFSTFPSRVFYVLSRQKIPRHFSRFMQLVAQPNCLPAIGAG